METTKALFNPFMYHLDADNKNSLPRESRVTETNYNGEPVYVDGDYVIYKKRDKHYLHCYKNIIFAERCGANEQMMVDIKNDTFSGNGNQYHNFDRPKEYLKNGIEWSKKYNKFN